MNDIKRITLRPGENFWYHVYCLCTFGTAYVLKLIIKRAVLAHRASSSQRMVTAFSPFAPMSPSGASSSFCFCEVAGRAGSKGEQPLYQRSVARAP